MNDERDDIRQRLSELPKEIQPGRDLWPEVLAGMRQNGGVSGQNGATVTPISSARRDLPRRRHVPVGWAVAASAAFATIVGTGVWATMRAPAAAVDASTPVAVESGDLTVDPYTFASAGLAEYEAAAQDLQSVIEAGRDLLDPGTLQVLEQSLATIDVAIAEAQAALEADPGHEGLRRMLQQNHRRKLGLLRQAAVAVQSQT